MSKKIEVKKVVMKIGNKEIDLSVEEALELKDILNKTFPDEKFLYVSTPLPIVVPVIIERPVYPVYPTWTITYGDNITTGTNTYSSNNSITFI